MTRLMIKIKDIYPKDLTQKQVSELKKLCLPGRTSSMRIWLYEHSNWPEDSEPIVIAEENSKIVGWSSGRRMSSQMNPEEMMPHFNVFVSEPYRGKNIGEALAKAIITLFDEPFTVGFHNDQSRFFWKKIVKNF